MTMVDVITFAFSLIAIIVSVVSIYLQYMVEGASIEILNDKDDQRAAPRMYSQLPNNIQDNFSDHKDEFPGYVLIRVVLGNAGDRVGIANIQEVKAHIKDSSFNYVIKPSYNPYTLIPAYEIVEKEIMFRNAPMVSSATDMEVDITLEHGGYHPKTGKYLQKGTVKKTLHVVLVPGSESGWYRAETGY